MRKGLLAKYGNYLISQSKKFSIWSLKNVCFQVYFPPVKNFVHKKCNSNLNIYLTDTFIKWHKLMDVKLSQILNTLK